MFSIIMPTYNRASLLERTLPEVFQLTGIERCEILVVDDGSTDRTPDVLQRFRRESPCPFRILRRANGGPGMARNAAIHEAVDDFILFLDDDVFPCRELLAVHEAFLKQWDVSQGILAWHPEIQSQWVIRFMESRGMQFGFDKAKEGEPLSFLYVYTANLALPRRHVLANGGFDEDLSVQRYAFEDTAFAYSLERAGLRIGLNRKAWAHHLHPITEAQLVQREYKVGFSAAVLERKYPAIAQAIHLQRIRRGGTFQWRILDLLLRLKPLTGLLPRSLLLRLRIRESFLRGGRDHDRR